MVRLAFTHGCYLTFTLVFISGEALADPPGFRRVQITNTPEDLELNPRINDLGRIAFSRRIGGFFEEWHEEIFLYRDGSETQITDDEVQDRLPDLNNDELIAWSRFVGPHGAYGPTGEIARWSGQDFELVTDDSADDFSPRVNLYGHVVWQKHTYTGCQQTDRVIKLLKGDSESNITDGTRSDQIPVINDAGTVVWGRYDFCEDKIIYSVMMYSDGEITELSPGPKSFGPRINQKGVIAWSEDDGIVTWTDGVVTNVVDHGTSPYINSRGDIAFIRFDDATERWQTWLYLGGEIRLIAKSVERNEIAYDMNERGDIVTGSNEYALAGSEVVLYLRLPDGDLNCDERVDFDDIDGFVAALTNRADYEQRYSACDWWLADMTGNRSVDFDDIDGFVNCLVNGGCERP